MRFRRKTLSLTARLTIAYTLSSVGLILISTGYLYWSLVNALDYRDKRAVSSKLDALRSVLTLQDDGAALRFRIEKEWPARTAEVFYVRLRNEYGKVLAESPGGIAILNNAPTATIGKAKDFYYDGQLFRSLVSNLEHEAKRYTVQIVLDRTEERSLVSEYRTRLFVVLALCSVGCALMCFQIARRGLRPIREMARTAANITSSTLDERMVPNQMPSELAYLATSFDAMLDRLKASFDRLQRFSADIAHELRTPVNNISGELQVALGKDRPAEYYKDAIGSCLEECSRISRIIDSLLFLAHAQNPQMELSKEPINLRKELEAALEFYEVAAVEKGITCSLRMEGDFTLNVERTLFQRAVGNILSNAIKNTERGGNIEITGSQTQRDIRIEIRDSGVGIPQEHLPHLFDRFYRVDASRSKDSGGSGLGLAIVKSIASIHGGEVEIASEIGVGTRVSFFLPHITIS